MTSLDVPWETRLTELWAMLPDLEPSQFVGEMRKLVDQLPPNDSIGLFELGCSQDSTGHSDLAVPLYRAALAGNLYGLRRRRATIQLASSLRNIGDAEDAAELLACESEHPEDELSSAVSAFHALALSDLGRSQEALNLALTALAKYLPRYNESLGRYAADLVDK